MNHPFEVGDRVLIRTGGSPATQKYGSQEGSVTMVLPGLDEEIVLDVRVDGNNYDTVFEEGDLLTR